MLHLSAVADGPGPVAPAKAYLFLPPYSLLAYLRGATAVDERQGAISAALPDPAYDCAYQCVAYTGIARTG